MKHVRYHLGPLRCHPTTENYSAAWWKTTRWKKSHPGWFVTSNAVSYSSVICVFLANQKVDLVCLKYGFSQTHKMFLNPDCLICFGSTSATPSMSIYHRSTGHRVNTLVVPVEYIYICQPLWGSLQRAVRHISHICIIRFTYYNTRDRSITHSLQISASTKPSISQLEECIWIFYNILCELTKALVFL